MVNHIVLLGAGQLGSRYLQGMVGSQEKLLITAVDQSQEALDRALSRWLDANGHSSIHAVNWLTELPSDMLSVDLVICATSSLERADLVAKLSERVDVGYWILEKVLAQSSSDLKLMEHSLRKCQAAWVNTPRRMMGWHKALKRALSSDGPYDVSISGASWGLACNSIHFMDLVSWWSGEVVSSIDTSGLDSRWHKSKRPGYFEIYGELLVRYSGGSLLRMSSNKDAQPQPMRVALSNGEAWEINELAGTAVSSNGRKLAGEIELQSQLSGRLVDGIIQQGKCDLPEFEALSNMHAIFLDALLQHWNASCNRNDCRVPIT